MTKVRQTDQIHFKHPTCSSHLFKTFPPDGRDDSPVSVITHSAIISQPSSACASMEHHIYQDAKLHLYQEHGYSTSDDDAFYSGGSLSQDCSKVGTLESLPETHSLALNVSPRSLLPGSETAKLSSSTSRNHFAESKDFSEPSDSTITELDTSTGSNADQVSPVLSQEGTEACIDLFPGAVSRGVQDKQIVTRSITSKSADPVLLDDATLKDVEDIKISGKNRCHDASFISGDFASEEDCKEAPTIEKSISESKESHKKDLHQMKATNANASNRGFTEKLEDGSKKRYTFQGPATGILRTFPSPGTPPRSSFSSLQPISASHTNQGCSGLEKGAAHGVATIGTSKGIRAPLPSYFSGPLVKPGFSKVLPSKWDDAEKWLVNASSADSPSHPQSRIGSASALPVFPRTFHGASVGKRTGTNGQSSSLSAGKPAECFMCNSEGNGGMSLSSSHHFSAASDSELPTTPDNRALVRTNSQKYKQRSQGSKFARVEESKCDPMLKLHSSPDCLSGRKEAPTSEKSLRNIGTSTAAESARVWSDVKDAGGPMRGRINDGQATNSYAFWKFPSDAVERGLQTGVQSEVLTQDKYADTVVETLKYGSSTVKEEFVVQTPRHGRSASMKDAATEISPTVSRRDMATQITPLGSSRTSRCTTPIKNNSPARHNTPARRSASWSHTGFNLIELESCHLAKLELRDLPAGSQFQSFDKSVSNWSTREEEEEESSKCLRQLDIIDVKNNVMEARAAAWEEAEQAKFTAKYRREEAKIEAWENHQKAKAEAELKKLEVKLEKLRSQATEKIMNKLASSLKRAEEMRAAAQAEQAEQVLRAAERAAHIRKHGHFPASFGMCFTRLS